MILAGFQAASSKRRSRFNAATGGTEATVSNYNGTGQTWKVHTFTSNGTFTVSQNSNTFRVVIQGGGGGGGGGRCGVGQPSCWGAGGGGGGHVDSNQTISIGANSIVIGGAGGVSGSGGSSSIPSATATGGGGGSPSTAGTGGTPSGFSGGGAGGSNSRNGGHTDNITGTSVVYGSGGGSGGSGAPVGNGEGGRGAQRTGGDFPDGTGQVGKIGIVILSYRIA